MTQSVCMRTGCGRTDGQRDGQRDGQIDGQIDRRSDGLTVCEQSKYVHVEQ